MAPFSPKMNLANFTCRFGEKHVMLDLFEEVVWPAFAGEYRRVYSNAEYFLIDVALIKKNDAEAVLCGRLVKNTPVSRDQVFKEGKIVPDWQAIDSAPTSFFTLTLSDHKLLYVREKAGAPGLPTFTSTLLSFLQQAYRDWITQVYDEAKEEDSSTTWKIIMEKFPRPSLDITPISTESSVSAYVEKFRVINTLEVRLLRTNHELDNSPIFGDLRDVQDVIGADNISLKTEKRGEVGLDKGSVAHLIAAQAEEGNSRIVLRGIDLGGSKLKAENESFNLAIPVKELPPAVEDASNYLLEKLQSQVSAGVINLKKPSRDALSKLKAIIARIDWS